MRINLQRDRWVDGLTAFWGRQLQTEHILYITHWNHQRQSSTYNGWVLFSVEATPHFIKVYRRHIDVCRPTLICVILTSGGTINTRPVTSPSPCRPTSITHWTIDWRSVTMATSILRLRIYTLHWQTLLVRISPVWDCQSTARKRQNSFAKGITLSLRSLTWWQTRMNIKNLSG